MIGSIITLKGAKTKWLVVDETPEIIDPNTNEVVAVAVFAVILDPTSIPEASLSWYPNYTQIVTFPQQCFDF
jgi:hypothetical protein